jgi:hypothetical protein
VGKDLKMLVRGDTHQGIRKEINKEPEDRAYNYISSSTKLAYGDTHRGIPLDSSFTRHLIKGFFPCEFHKV